MNVINFLQTSPDWDDTAVVIAYDDSDGWYDHQMGPIVNQSTSPADALTGTGTCGDGSTALPGIDSGNPHAQGRCGYGPRLPLLVVSPWARENFVDNTVTDQTSVLRFIEDNWLGGERIGGGRLMPTPTRSPRCSTSGTTGRNDTLFLNPISGQPARHQTQSELEAGRICRTVGMGNSSTALSHASRHRS